MRYGYCPDDPFGPVGAPCAHSHALKGPTIARSTILHHRAKNDYEALKANIYHALVGRGLNKDALKFREHAFGHTNFERILSIGEWYSCLVEED